MITFACRHCKKSITVKDEFAGKTGKCPQCKQSTAVPAQPAAADVAHVAHVAHVVDQATAATIAPQNPGASATDTQSEAKAAGAPGKQYDFLAPAQSADEIGRLGSYRVLKVLGAGGMGVVFLAEDTLLERKIALKAMLPSIAADEAARLRFMREAKTAASITHDHIVRIYLVGEDRGVPFIAMELLQGQALDQRLKGRDLLPLKQVVRIGKETALGLAAAHKSGLVHRDIKPANLWIEQGSERVKILDFGLARATGGDNAHITQSGAIMGTPAYMAPEQANGQTVDARTDLFSLGCVLYHLTTGTLPFKGSDTISTLVAVASQDPAAPNALDPNIPRPLSRLIMKLLAKNPSQRAASTDEVAEVLAELETSDEINALANKVRRVSPKTGKAYAVSGTMLEEKGDLPPRDRGVLASKRGKRSDLVETATELLPRRSRSKDEEKSKTNPLLVWGLVGGGVVLLLLIAVAGGLTALAKAKNGSSGQVTLGGDTHSSGQPPSSSSSSSAIVPRSSSASSVVQPPGSSSSQVAGSPSASSSSGPAPRPKERGVEVMLPEATGVFEGGGGRFFVFHFLKAKKLQIFDVIQAKVVREIEVPSDVIFTCGRDRLFVIYPSQKRIEPWSLKTLERETSAAVPDEATVSKVFIGSDAVSPLVLYTGGKVVFLDGEKLEKFTPTGEVLRGEAKPGMGYELQVSADGQTIVGWTPHLPDMHYSVMHLDGRNSRVQTTPDGFNYAGHWAMPNADGRLLLRHRTGAYSDELRPLSPDFSDTTLMPSADPHFIIGLHGQDNGFDQLEIITAADLRSVFTVKDIDKFNPGSSGIHYGLFGERQPRIHYIPALKLLVMFPQSDDRIVLRSFDLMDALAKSGANYLFVSSIPETHAHAGKPYKYHPEIASKSGGLKYELILKPDGMNVSEQGDITWQAPQGNKGKSHHVVVEITDSVGKRIQHSFELFVVE